MHTGNVHLLMWKGASAVLEASPVRILTGAKVEWKGAFTNYLFDIKLQQVPRFFNDHCCVQPELRLVRKIK